MAHTRGTALFHGRAYDGLQKQNPDSDIKISSQWWVPSVNLGAGLQAGKNQR